MVPVCQHFSSAVGPGAIDPDESGAGKAGVDCAPPGDSRTSQPAVARERQRLRNVWPRTSWPRLNTSRPRICGPQSRAPSVRKISSQPLRQRGIEQSSWGGLGVPVCRGFKWCWSGQLPRLFGGHRCPLASHPDVSARKLDSPYRGVWAAAIRDGSPS